MIKLFILVALFLSITNGFLIRNIPMRGNKMNLMMCESSESEVSTEEGTEVPSIEAVTEVDTKETSDDITIDASSESTTEDNDSTEETSSTVEAGEGFGKFEIGQEYDAKVISAKQFGIFVEVNSGQNILIPRSQLTRGSYEKLKTLATTNSKDLVKIELIGVDKEKETISAKYLAPGHATRTDISSLEGQDLSAKFYDATIISTHDFGVFAELDSFGVEGLVPASKLPEPLPKGSIQASYKAGDTVQVKIEQLSIGDRKLVLSMDVDPAAGNPLGHVPHTKWFQGVIQNVASFGLFVRPAGYDAVGLVHHSRIPRGLTNILKKQAPIDSAQNKTDCEQLFSPGDVVRCRVHSALDTSRKIELSMLPYRATDDDDDDYIVEGRDPEEEAPRGDNSDSSSNKNNRRSKPRRNNKQNDYVPFDPEDTLLWWKGSPYTKVGYTKGPKDEEIEVINESSDIIEGTWRRMFEVDMRKDADDFSSKVMEIEMRELANDIGELNGLDEEIVDTLGFGAGILPTKQLGSFVTKSSLPDEWIDELEFFKDLENGESTNMSGLKAGKKGEQEEFERLLREVEAELAANAAAKKGSAAASEMATVNAESAMPTAEEVSEAISTDPKTGEASASPAAE